MTCYVSANRLSDLQSAERHELPMIRGKSECGCAPQVFYFEPQQKWYLIFQNRDSNYQSLFSTTTTIDKPETWSQPIPLLRKDTPSKWIDFWIICDQKNAYLYYTQGHDKVIVRSTSLEKFPRGWGEAKTAFEGVHEAVHVYKVKNRDEYHMFHELNIGGIRSFGLAKAEHLAGPWTKVTDRYATGDQIRHLDGKKMWTEMVSHGELLRVGYDQRMEYEPSNCTWLIQGILKAEAKGPYHLHPWKLGLIRRGEEPEEK